MIQYAVEANFWKISQDEDTLVLTFSRLDEELDTWQEERRYTHEELYDILVQKVSERMRGVEDANVR